MLKNLSTIKAQRNGMYKTKLHKKNQEFKENKDSTFVTRLYRFII